jgi:protein-S-isoprenylcysteine O-methyltransferase Ste14
VTHSSGNHTGEAPDNIEHEGMVTAMIAFALVAAAQQGAEQKHELPMPAWAYGTLALVVFTVLLAITWSFRSIGNRH